MRRYEVIGHEGGEGVILLAFRGPWGVYFRVRSLRIMFGPLFRRPR